MGFLLSAGILTLGIALAVKVTSKLLKLIFTIAVLAVAGCALCLFL